MTHGIAVIGCGLIGGKRAKALAGQPLLVCADTDHARAKALAAQHPGAKATGDWREAISNPDVSIVIVATTNDALASIALAAVSAGKHVLIEKPAARKAGELPAVMAACKATGAKARVGFNHRYHPAFRKALGLVRDGAVGDLMFLRGRYGHGGRIGYDREWRADPEKSGGGELLDQGVHLIDLSRALLGEFDRVEGFAHTYFWDMPVDDNAFMLLRTKANQTAFLHVSWTEWKNLFSLEIYGRTGKLQIDGLGGSYGTERLTYYRMLPQMGPPDTESWDYPGPDESWNAEFAEFLEDIRLNREPAANVRDAHEALRIVEKIYEASKT